MDRFNRYEFVIGEYSVDDSEYYSEVENDSKPLPENIDFYFDK